MLYKGNKIDMTDTQELIEQLLRVEQSKPYPDNDKISYYEYLLNQPPVRSGEKQNL
jgi:hypothetical protein